MLGPLDLFPYHHRLFHASRNPWDICLLAAGVDLAVGQEEVGQMSGKDRKEDFPLHVKQGDASELAEILRLLFFWDEGGDRLAT